MVCVGKPADRIGGVQMADQPNQEHVNNLKIQGVVRSFFKTISLKSVDERIVYTAPGNYIQRLYADVLKDAGYVVDATAERVLKNLEFMDSNLFHIRRQADLYLFHTTPSFAGARRIDFFRTVQSVYPDIMLCSPEVGPELRLQYPEQRVGEVLRIGMHDIMQGATSRGIFLVSNLMSAVGEQRRLMIGSSGVQVPYVSNNEIWVFMSQETRHDYDDFEG